MGDLLAVLGSALSSSLIRKIEALFTAHDAAGYPTTWTDQDGKIVGEGANDMTLAPNGEPYVSLSSFGIDAPFPDVDVMFASGALAMRWWADEVEDYARDIETDREKWSALHLYWRSKPVFHASTYLAMDQGGLMRSRSPLAQVMQIELGFVTSEMLISKIGPDGKEG